MSGNVDPKNVLKLINSMGYKNVSANELKDFTKDLKKLMRYEQKSKTIVEKVPQVRNAPGNVINVTIIKEASPSKADQPPTKFSKAKSPTVDVQMQTDTVTSDRENDEKQSKRFLRLPKHIKTKNSKIIYKKGVTGGGVLVRNTPTDLYKKYQEDWIKFKSFIPGENDRFKVRRSVRSKMQQKDYDEAKVYVHFPDETGDH